MGLSVSDLMRMTLARVARDKALPFHPEHIPNEETAETLRKSRRGEDVHQAKDITELALSQARDLMRSASYSTRFERDLRLAEKRGKDITKLKRVIALLPADVALPAALLDHAPKGEMGRAS